MVQWRPAGAVIEAEWTAADGQEREGFMKRARRMALAPAGEQSAGSQDDFVCVRVCVCVCPVIVLTAFSDYFCVNKEKKDTCKESHIQKLE